MKAIGRNGGKVIEWVFTLWHPAFGSHYTAGPPITLLGFPWHPAACKQVLTLERLTTLCHLMNSRGKLVCLGKQEEDLEGNRDVSLETALKVLRVLVSFWGPTACRPTHMAREVSPRRWVSPEMGLSRYGKRWTGAGQGEVGGAVSPEEVKCWAANCTEFTAQLVWEVSPDWD